MKLRHRVVLVLGLAVFSGCGDDGRELAAPTTLPPVPATTTAVTASVLVVETNELPAEAVSETAPATEPPTSVSPAALAEFPNICGPYAKVVSLEESRAVVRSQGEAAMIASEQRRSLELQRLGSSLAADTPPDVLGALDELRAVDMSTEQLSAAHETALGRLRTHFGPLCGVGA